MSLKSVTVRILRRCMQENGSSSLTAHSVPSLRRISYTILARRRFHRSHVDLEQRAFEGLTQSRITTPWLDALENQKKGISQSPTKIEQQDLSPKKMSDTYHRAV